MKNKYKYIIISIICLLVTSLLFMFSYVNNKKIKSVKAETIKKENKKIEKEEVKEEKIYFLVDIKGAVNTPGVYKLEENSRVNDVINMAGGLKEDADTSIINLSKKIEDEMVIIVYTFKELEEYKSKLQQMQEIEKNKKEELVCPDTVNTACINIEKNDTKENKNKKSTKEEKEDKIISINTGTKEELMSISGIGEGKAESIIKYREENGNFESIEDIKNVSGIGDSLFEKIKDHITV